MILILRRRDAQNASVLKGVILQNGTIVKCKAFVLCAGTFLRGLMHTGTQSTIGGRYAESSAEGLTESLKN